MSLRDKLAQIDEIEEEIVAEIQERRSSIKQRLADLEDQEMLGQFEPGLVEEFLKKPYVILPRGNKDQEWLLVIPKFFDFNIGWLLQSTDSYNVFIVNKYADYLGAVPKEFQSLFKFRPRMPLKVLNGMMLTGEAHQDAAWERYKKFLSRREGSDRIRVRKGKSFELISSMIDDGILPFMRNPVQKEHMIRAVWDLGHLDTDEMKNVMMRLEMPFFTDAFNQFLKTGAVGIYWATGVGKTLIGLHALATIKVDDRPNVVISGTRSALKDQWEQRLNSVELAAETIVVPFQSWHKVKDLEIGVLVIDECHALAANTFSRLATANCEYRMGLSATPYREDGRSDYIFALTGFPVGLDWRVLIDLGLIIEPEITMYICSNKGQKRSKLAELLRDPEKTLIYCFGVAEGKSLSREFSIPFVYGDTPVRERLQIVKDSNQTIVSSAMGEGISVRNIKRTITYDFLFGSRREETQFFGRLLHGKEKGKHVILMTDEEEERYGHRLYGIMEKGFRIAKVRVGGSARATKSKPAPRTPKAILTAPRQHGSSERVVTAPETDEWHQYPFLDERDGFEEKGKEMIMVILKSDYARSQQGLLLSQIKAILDHWHIKYKNYDQINNAIKWLYGKRKIAARREGKARRYMVVE